MGITTLFSSHKLNHFLRRISVFDLSINLLMIIVMFIRLFSRRSKDYSYVDTITIRSCSTYLDHTWKTTLAGEYAPPAILEQKV